MSRLKIMLAVAVLLVSSLTFGGAPKTAVYSWAPLPSAEERDVLMKETTSPTGLLLLDREAKFGFDYSLHRGVPWEDTLRFLVLNETGTKNATITLHLMAFEELVSSECRIVRPDGGVEVLDPKTAVREEDQTEEFGEGSPLHTRVQVLFPAPPPGSILDIHITSHPPQYEGNVTFDPFFCNFRWMPHMYSYMFKEAAFPETPVRHVRYLLWLDPHIPWQILKTGSVTDHLSLKRSERNEIELSGGPIAAQDWEPSMPPSWSTPILLSYIDFGAWFDPQQKKLPKGGSFLGSPHDGRGRLPALDFAGTASEQRWKTILTNMDKWKDKYLRFQGSVFGNADPAALAPSSLPVRDRIHRLYDFTRANIRFSKDAKFNDSLKETMSKGSNGVWQGSLALSSLLSRAGIPHRVVFAISRAGAPFSPLVYQPDIFQMIAAIRVEDAGGPPLFLFPGYPGTPFPEIPPEYQNSYVLWLDGEKLLNEPTPTLPPGFGQTRIRCEVELLPDGTLDGTARMEQSGLVSSDWRLALAFAKDEKRKKRVFDWLIRMPGTRFPIVDAKVVAGTTEGDEPVLFEGKLRGPASPSEGGGLDLPLNLMVAGYTSPFVSRNRRNAVWMWSWGHYSQEVTIRLPREARLDVLPAPMTATGPGSCVLSYQAETRKEGDRDVVHVRLEFDLPLVVGTEEYDSWRAYQEAIERAGKLFVRVKGVSLPGAEAKGKG